MGNKNLTTPATLDGITLRKDGSASLRFATQELKDVEVLALKQFHNHFGTLLFSESDLQPKDIPQHDPEFDGKTPSQRLRSVIYLVWRQVQDEGKTTLNFEDYYYSQLENLIEQYKSKLPPRE